jgi:multiple sugar transport system substrate-binding protein
MNKKVLAFAAATATVLSLAACSSDSGDSGVTQISFAHWGNQQEADTIAAMVDAFEDANPDIKVEDQWIQGDYEQQVRVAIAGGSGPTLFQISDSSIRGFATSLQPVEVDSSAYYEPTLADSMIVGGEHLAIPFVAKPKVMAINGAIFDAAGVERPSADTPMSVDEFVSLGKQLTSGEGDAKVYGSVRLWFQGFLTVNDTWFFDGTECLIDDPATIATAEMVIDAETDGWAPTGADAEGQDMFDWLTIGRAAMQPDFGPWDIAKLAALDADIELVPVPGGGEPMEINGIGIGSYADEAETAAATTFAEFMGSDPAAQNLLTTTESSLGVPIIEASLDPFRAVAPDLNLEAFIISVSQSAVPPTVPNMGRTLESFWAGANERTRLGSGTESPSVVFPELQAGCQESLDELLAEEASNS